MKKVYIDETNQATIVCPKCRLEKNIDVANFKNTHKRLKAKCRCGEVFRLSLEFRKHYRKKVRLNGEYSVQGKDEKGEIIIEDISASGIRFASLKPHYISRNDTVELKFTLDDPMRTEINNLVKIMWIIDRNVGAQYIDPKSLEKDLGFYLKE
ncbi:MAG: PilZ domain-containing protein [Desulfobacteraceae bacterium]|nr:PilZ domain-containing protein [Desulfobacteraceae bacterium]MDH3720313.1 PilZ domain-containing protein [Desulfobacteraceae bacterium]MDH3835509.1 PilZ domain-containing protein [Desulfobacteraceae bacterium]MDH3880540.1 PilZ domain-containing protein [Desulfobacteraceae bacterium]MDH3957280.1 PilZ domain-containing protein [Desulfobacteraceae bacterium]